MNPGIIFSWEKKLAEAYMRLKSGGWYGDAFLLQHAVNLGMQKIVLDLP